MKLKMKNKKSKTVTYFKIPLAVSLFFLIYDLSFAGVSGTVHDMYTQGKGTSQEVCAYCHIPHQAKGDKIWSDWANEAQLTSGPSTTIGNMCYTCHDGTVTNIGLSTVFNASLQQHVMPAGQDCDMCHSVHDNTNGKFMNVGLTENYYCASCHNAAVNAGGLGDYTNSGNHFNYGVYDGAHPKRFGSGCYSCHYDHMQSIVSLGSCKFCHEAHAGANYSTPSVSKPILRIDNTDSAFCISCHPAMQQATTGGNKHPANLTAGGNWGIVDCHDCHDVHQPNNPNNPFILRNQNTDSGYCAYCHEAINETYGPKIGNGHPVNIAFGAYPPIDASLTPAGNAIDDDAYYGIDYPANSSDMICETCHSVHRKGVASPLLRMSITDSSLCLNCHQM